MPDIQEFDNFIGVTVGHDVRRADQLPCAFNFRRSSDAGEARQSTYTLSNGLGEIVRCQGIVFLNTFDAGYKLV